MTYLEIYAFYGAPLLMLLLGYGLYLLARHDASRPEKPPAER